MLKVGLTGGIAAGKTVVGEILIALGAHVVRADEIAHNLLRPGESVYEEVVQQFGAGILNPDKTVNRAKLAELAFGDGSAKTSRIAELNKIIHPAVIQRQEAWMEETGQREPSSIAVVEAALLLEAGAGQRFDRLIVVTCTPEQRIQRFARRLGISPETARKEVERRMAAQLSDEEKIKAADYVIDNSGILENTRRQVESIYAGLRAAAG